MADISLSKAVRSNLLSLKGTADMMAATQNRLATGNKVNSALDNPSSWFTAKGLTNRASDLGALLDSMANGVKTLEAADNGLSAMTKTLESMQSTLRQARQDKSFQTQSYVVPTTGTPAGTETMTFSGGSFATAPAALNLTKSVTSGGTVTPASAASITGGAFTAVDFTNAGADDGEISFSISIDGAAATPVTIGFADVDGTAADNTAVTAEELAGIINTKVGSNIASVSDDGELVFTSTTTGTGSSLEITGFAATNGATGSGIADAAEVTGSDSTTTGGTTTNVFKTVDELVTELNAKDGPYAGQLRASNDNGKLRIENLSTQDLTVTKPAAFTGDTTIDGNSVRAGLSKQFNELRDQLDKLADDASFNGINLLRGDKLAITFNETGTSSIDIQTENGKTINSSNLGVATTLEESDLDSDTNIDAELTKLKTALNEVRSQASSFGSNLSIVQNRQTFTESMINTLESGAGNLTLADMNTEAANLLALQTRQSLSQNSLSLASQADQSILQLIR